MLDKVLIIDDDENLLASFKRTLRTLFDIATAPGGQQGLETLKSQGPFAVIVADMYMPGADGIKVLSQAKSIAPDSVRMILTGHADLPTAINAVNEGHVFRFLTKPCEQEILVKAIKAGVDQYRLLVAERQLLEETLNGSIKVLVEILSLISPKAFGRCSRVQRFVRQMAQVLELPNLWQYEVAAMLSQIGCVTLSKETLEKVFANAELSPDERQAFDSHPDVGGRLIVNIPRLQDVAHMIARQGEPFCWDRSASKPKDRDHVALGGHVLKVALDFDQMLSNGVKPLLAMAKLKEHSETYDPDIVHALEQVNLNPEDTARRAVGVDELDVEMILDQDVFASNGNLLVAKGQEVTITILEHLRRWKERVGVVEPISVLIYKRSGSSSPTAKSP